MEEEPIVEVQEPTPFRVEVAKSVISQLLTVIQMNYEQVTIKSTTGKVFGILAEPYCMLFDYYATMKFSVFKEASTEKVMTIACKNDNHDIKDLGISFTEEQCQFFVDTVPKLFSSTLNLSGKQIVWLFKFFDTFTINELIGQTILDNISISSYNKMHILDQIICECANKNPGPYLSQIYKKVITDLWITVDNWTLPLITYSLDRNIIVKILKDDHNYQQSKDEGKLFRDIVNKVVELNRLAESNQIKKISMKAFLDIMACLK